MRLVIDSRHTVSGSLHFKVAGFSIELSDIFGKVAIIEDSGRVSIEVLPFDEGVSDTLTEPLVEIQEVEKVSQEESLNEAVPEVLDISLTSPDLLFQKLVALRKQIAKEVKLPPYIIFHDTSLKDMVSKLPVDLEAMGSISGVGQAKLEKYGVRFVDAIKEYLAESA